MTSSSFLPPTTQYPWQPAPRARTQVSILLVHYFYENKYSKKPTMAAEWSKALSQIQVEIMPQVTDLNPAWDYNIDRSEVEILCQYSNSRAESGDAFTSSCDVLVKIGQAICYLLTFYHSEKGCLYFSNSLLQFDRID